MESNKRVVITGIGLVTPLAQGTNLTWSRLLEGRSGIGPITLFDPTEHPARIAGEVSDFDPSGYITPKELKRMDRFIQFALVAAQSAAKDAGLEVPVQNAEKAGVLIVGLWVADHRRCLEVLTKGAKRLSLFMLPKLISNLAPSYVLIALGTKVQISFCQCMCDGWSCAR